MTATPQIGMKCLCGSDKFEMPKNSKPLVIIRCARRRASERHDEVMR